MATTDAPAAGTTGAPAPNAPNAGYMADLGKNIFEVLGDKPSIYIKQGGTGREVLEAISGCEISNRFTVQANQDSAPLFQLKEDSNCCVRQCCKNWTPFNMDLLDMNGEKQLSYERPYHCTNTQNMCPCCWICNCCAYDCACGTQELIIRTKDGSTLGRVAEEKGSWCGLASYSVSDAENVPKFICLVPCCEVCKMCCCQDVDLCIMRAGDSGDEEVATITRKCICDCVNVMTDKDHFEVKFLDTKLTPLDKFYIMSMVILVKYVHFEQSSDGGGGGG